MAAWSWYTKGRRIPTLIGKDVSGRRIPGGPYTGMQAVTAAVVPALMWWTRGLWAADLAGLAMFVVLAGVTVGSVKLVGKVDFASRNPLLLFGGYLRQTGRPSSGTLAGRKLSEPKPHRVAAVVEAAHLEPAAAATTTELAADPMVTEPAEPADASQPAVAASTSTAARPSPPKPPEPVTGVADSQPVPNPGQPTSAATVTAALRPASTLAPDRRRTGLEAFLAGAAAARTASTEEDAA